MLRLSSLEKFVFPLIALITGMIVCRILYVNNLGYIFLLWNLFLAWIPFQLSMLLPKISSKSKWLKITVFSTWLLFFPNALYLVTDLIHLEDKGSAPLWYDAILLFTGASTGLIMAFASLYKVEIFLQHSVSLNVSHHSSVLTKRIFGFVLKKEDKLNYKKRMLLFRHAVAVTCLFLGSIGVYVGRFLRWNSWDVITDPLSLIEQVTNYVLYSPGYVRPWSITCIFTILFTVLYFMFKKLPGLLKEPGNIK